MRDNRSQRKSKSVKQKYNTPIYGYCKNCKDCLFILGKINTVMVRNEPKLQTNFGLLDFWWNWHIVFTCSAHEPNNSNWLANANILDVIVWTPHPSIEEKFFFSAFIIL